MLTEIEQLQIEPDLPAKIVIDERSGIIVMGRDVRVSTVAVAQGNLTVTIRSHRRSASRIRSRAADQVVPRSRSAYRKTARSLRRREGISLQQLVDGLNSLGMVRVI